MRRLSLILGLLLTLAFAIPVSAATVDRFKYPNPAGFAAWDCGFEVDANITIDKEYETDFYDNAGNLLKSIVTGRFVLTFVNPANGLSIVENASGPGIFDYEHAVFEFLGVFAPNTNIAHGRLVFGEGLTGNIVSLCAYLTTP